MDSLSHAPAAPISFFRHARGVLGAALVAATALAIAAGLLATNHFHNPAAGLMIAMTTWFQVYIAVIPLGGMLFTAAYPVTRSAQRLGMPIAALLGTVGAVALAWADKDTEGAIIAPIEIITAMLIGAMIGCAYWLLANKR